MKFKFIFLTAFLSINLSAQVGINTPEPDQSSILDITDDSKGVLIPRITQLSTISNPAKGLLVYDLTKNCLSQNVGTPESPNWVCMSANTMKFFYMPSIVVETNVTANEQTKNLYELYKKQFSNPEVSSFVSGNSGETAPPIPYFPNATDLYYYVTDYDNRVFSNIKINSSGVMTYDVTVGATNFSYMNIVFVVK